MPRRIGLCIYSLAKGGAEGQCALLAGELAKHGDSVRVATLVNAPSAYPLPASVAHDRLDLASRPSGPFDRLVGIVRRLRGLRRWIVAQQFDLVLSFMDATNLLTLAATVGVPVCTAVFERIDPGTAGQLGPLARIARDILYRRACAVFVQTERAGRTLPAALATKLVVLPNLVPPPTLTRLPHREGPFRLVAAGRLVPQKGFDLLVAAAALLHHQEIAINIDIYGDGPERDALAAQIAAAGLEATVVLRGFTDDLDAELATAGAFVLPSRFEGFPNALCEALRIGLPAIAADCRSGPAEIINHGENGLLVPPENPAALAQAILRLMADPALADRLGRAGADSMRALAPDRVVPRLLDHLDRLCAA